MDIGRSKSTKRKPLVSEDQLSATMKRVRIALHPAQLRLSKGTDSTTLLTMPVLPTPLSRFTVYHPLSDFVECESLEEAGVLEWQPAPGSLCVRMVLRLPGPALAPAAFLVTVPRTYPNRPPVVFVWQDGQCGAQVEGTKVPILATDAWLPIYSLRDVTVALIKVLYDVRELCAGCL